MQMNLETMISTFSGQDNTYGNLPGTFAHTKKNLKDSKEETGCDEPTIGDEPNIWCSSHSPDTW